MKLTDVIRIWDELHVKDVGELGFHHLDKAIEKVVGVENDIPETRPPMQRKND